jgi:DNA polymerase-3 subunit beta
MEFTVSKAELVKELALGQGVVEKKTTIPVLSNVLLEARENEIALTATDLELGLRSSCPATVKKPGASTLPARKLLDYVRLLPDVDLHVKIGETHGASITCGRSRTRIAGMSRENFPELPKMPAPVAQVPAALLASLISKTAFAISNEGSRYTLNGGLFLLKPDSVTMVSTDGHRLSFVESPYQLDGISGQLRALVPKKAMNEIQRLAAEVGEGGQVAISSDENHLFFQFGHRLLITRKLTGQFPDYERVLPRDNDRILTVSRTELEAALLRVSQFADERSHAVRVAVAPGELKLAASGSESGESEETLPVEGASEAMQIGFNALYLLDFLRAVSTDSVQLELKDEQSAGQLRPAGDVDYQYRYVVMPMRI